MNYTENYVNLQTMRFTKCVEITAERGRAISSPSTNDLIGLGCFTSVKASSFHLVKWALEISCLGDDTALIICKFSLDSVVQKTKSKMSLKGIVSTSRCAKEWSQTHSLTNL